MRLLYRSSYRERYEVVARLVPEGAKVVEFCCGCGFLYEKYLSRKRVEYVGIDLLPQMVGRLRRLGVKVLVGDLLHMDLPVGEVCVMLGSLYHFHPDEAEVIDRMARSGRGILLEPVLNISGSHHWILKLVAKYLSYIGKTSSSYRLESNRLDEVLRRPDLQILSDERVLNGKYRLVQFQKRADGEFLGGASES